MLMELNTLTLNNLNLNTQQGYILILSERTVYYVVLLMLGELNIPKPKQGYILMGRPVYYVVLLMLGGSMSFFMLKTVAAAIIPTGIEI